MTAVEYEVRRYRGGPTAARRHLIYCERELERDDLPSERVEFLTTKRDIARSYLKNHCRFCGHKLTSKVSLERGYGPCCAEKVTA